MDPDSLFLATASESDRRAAAVLPHGPSEDARHVLGPAPVTPVEAESEPSYGPNLTVEWTVTLRPPDGSAWTRQDIVAAAEEHWARPRKMPTLYGRDPSTEGWTYVRASDAPGHFDAIQLGWDYAELDAARANEHLDAARAAGRELGATVSTSVTPREVQARADAIDALLTSLDDASEVWVAVVAPAGDAFEGRELWDALTSLGLRWGDGDLFHWQSPSLGAGDDQLFSVATSTAPGFFFPEEAAAGRMRVADLELGMSVARTQSPLDVFAAMVRAAKYLARRLGGEVVGADGPLDEAAVRAHIQQIVERMHAAGMPPGSDAALSLPL